jgi:hypothetical protein
MPPREGGRISNAAIEVCASKRWAGRSAINDLIARAKEAEGELYHCDLGRNLLTMLCLQDELFVEFSWVRSIREEKKMEEHNAAIAADYEDRKARSGTSERDAAETVAALNGISPSRVKQIVEGQHLARGEEKRKRRRPKKQYRRGSVTVTDLWHRHGTNRGSG